MISWLKRVAVYIGYIVDEDVDSDTEDARTQQPKPPPSAPARTTTPDAVPGYEMPFDDVPW